MSYFQKKQDRWGNGYNGEKVLYIPNTEKDHAKFMHHYWKLWADSHASTI